MQAVDDYLNTLTDSEKSALSRIRNLVHTMAPDADEAISYGMPAFKKKYLIGYCAFKNRLSVVPGPGAISNAATKLQGFVTSKGTIQFTLDHPLPDAIIEELIISRIRDIEHS